jgi:4-amino-4-deoxy-L-arabinose transferase-like glycosyltransferase
MNLFQKLSPRVAGLVLILICLTSFGLMFSASRTDSAIIDELAHIPAGYGYVHNLDYRLNPEHPPLVKALAMLPVLFLNPAFPTNATSAWQTEINGEWDQGYRFLYAAHNDANAIVQTARIMPILLTILTLILVYFFAKRLMGSWWALLPAFLFGMSPTILAHGHYVTTDVGAAFGILLGTYFFTRLIESPSKKNIWLAGIAFGIAQLTKFSTPFLVPLFIFVLLVLWIRDMFLRPRREILAAGWRYLKTLIFILLIGYLCVVYPIYFLFTTNYPITKQVSDTTAILGSFANGPTPAGQMCHGTRCLADLDIWMSRSPVLRPFAEYTLGVLMVLQRVGSGNTIYFIGRVVGSGGWIYFPLLFLLKEPLPTLLIVITALILALFWMWKKARTSRWHVLRNIFDYISVNFAEFTMGSFIILYGGYSIHSSLNLGIRYLIPILPFIYILSAGVWKKWVVQFDLTRAVTAFDIAASMAKSVAAAFMKYGLLVILLVWLFCETLFAAPYFLSYFNELGGGVWNGYHYATDSNYDWGQDLLRLQAWINAHPEVDKIAVDYFGGGNPYYYLDGKDGKEANWSSSQGNPSTALPQKYSGQVGAGPNGQGIHWLAVSLNTLEIATQPLEPGQTRNASDSYSWLVQLKAPASANAMAGEAGDVPPPEFRIGTSIFVYHLQ